MKNKWFKIAGIILLIIVLIFLIWKISTYKEKLFNKFPFETYHHVINTTNVLYLDTIVHAGLQILKIDSVIVVIKPLINKEGILPGDLDVKGYIKGEGYTYIIFIDDFSKEESIKILSHELIHLKQYYNNELKIINNIPVWKGDTIKLDKYDYNQRPWEKEAFANEYDLGLKMNKILY